MNYSEKSLQVYSIILRDYDKAQLADWLMHLMDENTMDEILANEKEEE